MRCEELEAIVFSGRAISVEEREEMETHAKTCEACRALLDNAEVLSGVQKMDEDVTPPESFTQGWRRAIRQTPRVISISDWMRRRKRCCASGARLGNIVLRARFPRGSIG